MPSPVQVAAEAAGVPIIATRTLKDAAIQAQIQDLGADLGVVVAFGAIIPQGVLDMPTHGWINLHFSDLPRWRGAAPVQWAILSGDTATASSVFQLEAGLDTGPVYSRIPVAINHESAGELLARMAEVGAPQVLDVVDQIEAGSALATAQKTEGLTHAGMLTHEDGFIDFSAPATQVDQRIRALTPDPGAWTVLPDGTRMKILAAHAADQDHALTGREGLKSGQLLVTKKEVLVGCAQGAVFLDQVAPAGKSRMDAPAWARGARLAADALLGQVSGGAQ